VLGFDEAPGAELGLEALLGGVANFAFGNPMAQFWADLQGGAANPRVRRTQVMAIQLRQQMAAMQLREYHNEQVGRRQQGCDVVGGMHLSFCGCLLCALQLAIDASCQFYAGITACR
jgi:hypothetical protein